MAGSVTEDVTVKYCIVEKKENLYSFVEIGKDEFQKILKQAYVSWEDQTSEDDAEARLYIVHDSCSWNKVAFKVGDYWYNSFFSEGQKDLQKIYEEVGNFSFQYSSGDGVVGGNAKNGIMCSWEHMYEFFSLDSEEERESVIQVVEEYIKEINDYEEERHRHHK